MDSGAAGVVGGSVAAVAGRVSFRHGSSRAPWGAVPLKAGLWFARASPTTHVVGYWVPCLRHWGVVRTAS